MKRILIILFILTFISSSAFALKIGLWGGYNMLLNDLGPGAEDVTKGGLAFGAKLSLIDLPIISLGLIGGYLPTSEYKTEFTLGVAPNTLTSTYEYSTFSIPVAAFAQLSFGGIYLLGGAGAYIGSSTEKLTITGTGTYASQTAPTVETAADPTTDLGVMLGAGYGMGVGVIGVEAGGLYHMIFTEGESTKMLTLHAGVNLGF
ncbi:MAG: hypothetical protein JW827_00610 [Spirochaetes bacterium]|nr:hypothetical protein [Spirochaetota bacterium]